MLGRRFLTLDDLRLDRHDDAWVASMRARGPGLPRDTRLRLRLHDAGGASALDDSATPFLPVATQLAAMRGLRLRLTTPVDAPALAGAREAGSLLARWFGWRDPEPEAPLLASAHPVAARGAVFFSRGLDSLTTLVTQRAGVDELIGIDWIDIPPATPGVRAVWDATVAAAAEAGLPLRRVSTDLRRLLDPLAPWTQTFGCVLASCALLLAPALGRVTISATHRRDLAVPHGSHPDLDPLWSSSRLQIRHDGTHLGRSEKAALVVADPLTQRWLKVCWERDGEGNCGACAKCLLTMTNFAIAGRLEAVAQRFDGRLEAVAVGALVGRAQVGAASIAEVVDQLSPGALRDAWSAVLARLDA